MRGERLKQARQEAGLTLERAADLLGTSFNTIWRYEAGQRRPSGPTVFALASLYKQPVEWFYGEEEAPRLALRERLRQARQESGLTLEGAADSAGTSANTIWRYEAGQRQPSRLALFALSTLYNKPVEWFYGEEKESRELQRGPGTAAPGSVGHPAPDSPDVIGSLNEMRRAFGARLNRIESAVRAPAVAESRADYDTSDDAPTIRPVEIVELAAAAGGGAEAFDETVVGRLWFRQDWLQHNAIDPAQCNVISVSGESMEPTLPDGCSILVDRSQGRKRRRNGRIFVMRTGDGLVVKRGQKDENGDWQIVSDHPAWAPVPWADETKVIGEVRWYGVTL